MFKRKREKEAKTNNKIRINESKKRIEKRRIK